MSETRAGWLPLCHRSELPTDGTGRAFEVGGRRLAAFWHEGAPHVVDDRCPHEGASLGDGVLSRGQVTCPFHAFHFDLCTGLNADGLELSIEVFPVRLRADGTVEADLGAG